MIARRSTPQNEARRILLECGETGPEVDVENIAKNHFGLNVIYENLPDEISGVLDTGDDILGNIFVNTTHHPVRQRFTIAHELGHFVLHNMDCTHIDRKTFFRDKRSKESLLPKEIEANRFAAEILMPEPFVEKEISELDEEDFLDTDKDIIGGLAKRFNVSTMAMSLKFVSLGYSF